MKRIVLTVNGAACAGVIILLCAACAGPHGPEKAGALALTPQMGWNSWNKFQGRVSEQLIRETADAMATNGMKAAGYQYVNIDDLWQAQQRDAREIFWLIRHGSPPASRRWPTTSIPGD